MAKLPYLSSMARSLQTVGEFRGLNQTLGASDGEFADQKNVSSRYYPAISARKPRSQTLETLTKPNGLLHKNKLFWVDGTICYYDGTQVSGLTVTDSKKQLVGMGAYICIFPDKKVYNTHTGEIISIESTYTQSGIITFEETLPDSVYTKITATGIGNSFRQYDGITINNVGDSSFSVSGGVTKTIQEIGTDYITVIAPVQKAYTGDAEIRKESADKIRITGPGSDTFALNDTVKITGAYDDALNITGQVTATGTDYIIVVGAFATKSYTQGATMTIGPYYAGSDKTRLYSTDLNNTFAVGDVVTIAGCSNSSVNGSFEIIQAGTDYILIDLGLNSTFTQASGITITRTKTHYANLQVKRIGFKKPASAGITFVRSAPTMDYVCELNNRLWGCSSANHEIYASKLGDPVNWNCFEGISTDSYAVTVGSDGPFTGCIGHQGHALFFKEQAIHVMYGDRPSNFALNTSEFPGVKSGCSASLQNVNETLYYVGINGIYAYDGAVPRKISENIIDALTDAVSTQEDDKLYMSLKMNGQQTVLCFDPRLGIWDKENDDTFIFATYGGGKGYFIDADGNLKSLTGDDDSRLDWMLESPDIKENSIMEKYISKLMFNFWLAKDTEAVVYLKIDDAPGWIRKGSILSDKDKTYTIPIVPQRCHKYRYRIEVKGDGKLLSSGRYVEGGTELNGTVHHGHRRA